MNLLFTPRIARHESPHGTLRTYDEYQQRPQNVQGVQSAPDPTRYGDTIARPARMPIILMSTDPNDWNSGFAEDFLPYNKMAIPRFQHAGTDRQLAVRAQNSVGIRPNIDRGKVAAYGSLFSLSGATYDESRG